MSERLEKWRIHQAVNEEFEARNRSDLDAAERDDREALESVLEELDLDPGWASRTPDEASPESQAEEESKSRLPWLLPILSMMFMTTWCGWVISLRLHAPDRHESDTQRLLPKLSLFSPRDVTPPTILGPSEVKVAVPFGETLSREDHRIGSLLSGIRASDGDEGVPVVFEKPERFHYGSNTVHAKAVDEAGNVARKPILVTLVDERPPAIADLMIPAIEEQDLQFLTPHDPRIRRVLVHITANDPEEGPVKVRFTLPAQIPFGRTNFFAIATDRAENETRRAFQLVIRDPLGDFVHEKDRWGLRRLRSFLAACSSERLRGLWKSLEMGAWQDGRPKAMIVRRMLLALRWKAKGSFGRLISKYDELDGFDYHELLCWVAHCFGLSVDASSHSWDVERAISGQHFDEALAKLPRSELVEMARFCVSEDTRNEVRDWTKAKAIGALKTVLLFGRFMPYKLTSMAISGLSTVIGVKAGFWVYTGASRVLSIISGPIGWAALGLSILYAGAADHRTCIPFIMTLHAIKAEAAVRNSALE